MEFYSAVKKNAPYIHRSLWMNLKCVLLSERSQIPKATYYMIPFIRHYGKGQAMEIDNKQLPGFGGEGRVWLQRDLGECFGGEATVKCLLLWW